MPKNFTPLKVVNKYTQKWVAEYVCVCVCVCACVCVCVCMYVFFSSWKNLKWPHNVTKNLEQFGDDFAWIYFKSMWKFVSENECWLKHVHQ